MNIDIIIVKLVLISYLICTNTTLCYLNKTNNKNKHKITTIKNKKFLSFYFVSLCYQQNLRIPQVVLF